jgi:hypothetical protein
MTSIRLLPLQGDNWLTLFPKVLPWADCFWPFYKSLLLGILKTSFRLLSLNRDFQAVFIRTARKILKF